MTYIQPLEDKPNKDILKSVADEIYDYASLKDLLEDYPEIYQRYQKLLMSMDWNKKESK